MKELTIHHFPAKGRRRARVRVSYRPQEGAQAQEREAAFTYAITEKQRRLIQWYLEEYLLYPWGEFRNRAQQVEKLMEQLGVKLFDTVFRDRETHALYAHVADDLPNTRMVIHTSNPAGIALPWELMRDPTRREYGDLARLAHAFVRSQPDLFFQPPPEAAAATPFNILMVICRPGGPRGDVPFQSVARPLLKLFRPHRDRIHLDILRPPTLGQLSRVLADQPNFYHVLHFDGHGTFPQSDGSAELNAQPGLQGRLLFEGEDGRPREVTGEELGGVLAGKGVSIVLLNACQSGMTHPDALYPSVGNQLLKAGVRGVVAMTYSVYVQTAARFMARLYETLINGEELARAVALGREELRAEPQRKSPIGDIPLRDWVVPALFEAAPVRVTMSPPPTHGQQIRLDLDLLQDQQAVAGTEIDCPKPPAYGFFGRDGAILELERAFQTETVVLLDGMAGVGKTEMAVSFARWQAETGALDGPVFFFHFEHYLPLAQICDRVGQVFHQVIKDQLPQEWHLLNAEQRRRVALRILRRVPCLMIWDNFEPVAGFPAGTPSAWMPEEQGALRDFLHDLRGGQTKIVLTSRRDEPWLGNIYRHLELGGLTLAEGQELAVEVLRRAGLQPQQINALPQYNDLLHYLRGNPLAIQVILTELKHKTPDALLRDLQAGEGTLSADNPTQGREQSLTASLTYRLDALDPIIRQRLSLLGLFQGFVGAGVLTEMCLLDDPPDVIRGLGRDDWMQMLDTASEIGLLRRVGGGYYTVHPALPWFFQDLLRNAFPNYREDLERAFSAVYAGYGTHLSSSLETNASLAMSVLRAEESNLIYAVCLARQRERWSDIAGILSGLNRLLTLQGRWVEWERLIGDLAAEVTGAGGEPIPGREDLWIALLGHHSEIAIYRRDFANAQTVVLRLKDYYESTADDHNQAVALNHLGRIAGEWRQFEEAERWYQQSLAVAEGCGALQVQAATLHDLGIIAQKLQQFEEAERWYRQSLAIKKRLPDQQGQAQTLHQLGIIAQERQQLEEAERCYRQSLAIAKALSLEQGQGISLHQLGIIAQKREQFEEAERWYRQSLAIAERIGNKQGQAATLHQLGMIAQERRQFEEAERWYRQSLVIKEHIGDEQGQAATLHQLGMIA